MSVFIINEAKSIPSQIFIKVLMSKEKGGGSMIKNNLKNNMNKETARKETARKVTKRSCLTINLFFASLCFFMSFSAQALFEARLHGGQQIVSQDFNDFKNITFDKLLNLKISNAAGVDLVFDLPFFPVGIGLRYEQIKSSLENSDFHVELESERQSILINKRFIDFVGYFGLIGTLGFSHNNTYSVKILDVVKRNEKPETDLSYSVGIEGGFKIVALQIGLELGYLDWKMKGNSEDLDFSGYYGKVLLGFGF